MNIRQANQDEREQLYALHKRAFMPLIVATVSEVNEAVIWERFARDWHMQIPEVMERNGAIVGYFRLMQRSDHFWVDVMAVDPPAQGHGLGRHVLGVLRKRARLAGLPLRLSVYEHNRAITLYRRVGFQEFRRDGFRVRMALLDP